MQVQTANIVITKDSEQGADQEKHLHRRPRLRIVQLLNSLAVGGAERMALNLALAQRDSGHEPLLYCIEAEGNLALEARANGIRVTCFNKKAGKSVRAVAQIANSLTRDGADVLHTHNPSAHYYGAPAAWLARIPVVNTRHSPVSSRGAEYRERYFRWLLGLTDEVVFVSRHAQQQIEPQWAGRHVATRVIPNGVPVARFRRQRTRSGSNQPFVFGAIGRLVPVKCYDLLIDAFRLVQDRAPDSELHIVGDGPLLDDLRSHVISAGVQGRARIEPARLDVGEVFRSFDAFVVSSSSEGLPMVVLEAMAAGLPIVSTRVGGIAEAVQEGSFGWFCAPGNCGELADAMLATRRCSDLTERGQIAAQVAAAKYDVGSVAERYMELFAVLTRTAQAKTVRAKKFGGSES